MDMLIKQLEEIQQVENENIDQAFQAYQQLELSLVHAPNVQKAEFYLHYAFFMFRIEDYGQCMEFLAQAQEYGFSKEEIRQFVYEGFIEPNLAECKENYHMNMEKLKDNIYVGEDISFEDLRLWFIPTLTTNKKYFYDQLEEKIICVNADDKKSVEFPEPVNIFGDYLLAVDNIYEMISYIRKSPEQKKLYIYAGQIKYFLSFFQMSDLNRFLIFIQKVKVFVGRQSIINYFMQHNAYLPRNFISPSSDFSVEDIASLVDEIHDKRIHDLTRKRDNILLTIGIPSLNRGHRAYENVVYHLQSIYDDEIEIVISNNATSNGTESLYERISEIPDSRVSYCKLEKTEVFPINAMNVFEKSKGKYVLLTSDEDFVNLKMLDKILSILNSDLNLSVLKISGDGKQMLPSTKLTEAGLESLLVHSLTANHIYGNIMNRKIIEKYNGTRYIREHIQEILCNTYPNTYLELLLCQYGKVMGISDTVIMEGVPEPRESKAPLEVRYYDAKNNCVVVPKKSYPKGMVFYQTVEGRLKQHKQIFDIYRTLELFQHDFQVMRLMYLRLCVKTIYLVDTSLHLFYRDFYVDEQREFQKVIKQTYSACKLYLDEIYAMDYADLEMKKMDEEFIEKHLNIWKTNITHMYKILQ